MKSLPKIFTNRSPMNVLSRPSMRCFTCITLVFYVDVLFRLPIFKFTLSNGPQFSHRVITYSAHFHNPNILKYFCINQVVAVI